MTRLTIPDARPSSGSGAPERAARRAPKFWPPPRDGWIAIAGVALIYAAHWFYGAQGSNLAMTMNLVAAALLAGALASPRLREDLLRLKGLAAPAVCFALVIAVALWTLTPWTPGGPHPVWAYVGVHPGASTIDKSSTIVEILKLLGLACVFALGLATGARDERARYAVRLTLVAGMVFGLWAFIGAVSGTIYQSQGRRLEAHFLSPNTAGTLFAGLLLLALAEALRPGGGERGRPPAPRPLFPALAAGVFGVCLLDTASRGAMIALLAGALVYAAARLATGQLKMSRALLGGGLAAGGLIVLIAVAGDRLIDRLFASHEAAIQRTHIWAAHWRAFLDSPLFGYGLGTLETVNKTLLTASNWSDLWSIRSVHNVYLQWLEQAGLVGAAPMFLSLGLILLATTRGLMRRSRMTGLLAGLLGLDAVFLVHGLSDVALEAPSMAAFWAWALGLQFSLAQGSSRR